MFKYCKICLKPKTTDESCGYCKSNEIFHANHSYSIKQWEFFMRSLERGATHDFNPWEFDGETGAITRGGGSSGVCGSIPIKRKRKYNNRKLTNGRKKYREDKFF
jgi:hypothetical protein